MDDHIQRLSAKVGREYPGLLLQVPVEKLCLANTVLEPSRRLALIDVSSGL